MRNNVLIADDDERIREIVRLYLEADGFAVSEAANGKQVLDLVRDQTIDLILLDLMMPELDGWIICKIVRKDTRIPIIMLTAKGEENDRVLGFDLGADDYVVKPFSARELAARVKAVLRRSDVEQTQEHTITYPGVRIDRVRREVEINGQNVKLTTKEFDLLLCLAQDPGRIFNREQLLNLVWEYDYCGDSRTVDTHINRLRTKLDEQTGASDFIQTVRGVGYKFELNGRSAKV